MESFKPKQSKKEQITVRVESVRLYQLDAIAARLGMSRSEIVDQCIAFALEHLEEQSEQPQ